MRDPMGHPPDATCARSCSMTCSMSPVRRAVRRAGVPGVVACIIQ
jgi:hypothetical protein